MVETGGWGGIGHYTHCLCNALVGAGCELRLVTHAHRYELSSFAKSYPVHRVFHGDGQWSDWRQLFDLCRLHAPEIVHFQSLLSTRRDWLMFHWMHRKFPGIRQVVTVHNVLPHETAFGECWVYRRLYQAADGLIVHSKASERALYELMGASFDVPVMVIPHGHYGELSVNDHDRLKALEALQLQEVCYLTCFGAIRPYKGVDWLLRAVASIDEWPADVKVLVIGHLLTGVTEKELVDLCRNLAIVGRVEFRFGYVPEENIADVFTLSDLILLPYRHIDQSGVLMAALAAGRPVVCTPVGAFPEVVNTEVGFVAKNVSWEAFAEALSEGLRKRDAWAAMGKKARQMADRDFGWESIAHSTLSFYGKVFDR